VVLAIAVFVMATLLTGVGRRRRAGGGRNGDGENGHPDDLTLDGTLDPAPDLGS
jgi:hypothetical protein